jgi:hypothetical protein
MAATPKDLYIEQGATWHLGFNWHRAGAIVDGAYTPGEPYDLTGCTARMQIRRKQGDPVLFTGTSEDPGSPIDPEKVEAGAGRIKLGGPTGRIDITLTDEDTDAIMARSAFYDLEIEWPIKPGELRPRVDRLLQGALSNDPNITQTPSDPVVT